MPIIAFYNGHWPIWSCLDLPKESKILTKDETYILFCKEFHINGHETNQDLIRIGPVVIS